jgi:hypothetical protein
MDKTEKINNLREELIKIVINLEIDYNNPYHDGRTVIKFDNTNRLPSNISTLVLELFKKFVDDNIATHHTSLHNERICITITTFEKNIEKFEEKKTEEKNELQHFTCWYQREIIYGLSIRMLFFIFIIFILIGFILYSKFDNDFLTKLQTTLSNLNNLKLK